MTTTPVMLFDYLLDRLTTQQLLRPHYRRHALAFVTGFVLLVAANGTAALIPYLMKLATEALTGQQQQQVWWCGAGLIAAAATSGCLRLWSRVHIFRIGRQVEYDLRALYHAHLQRLPASFFDQAKTGDLVARGTSDITAVRMFIGPGFLQLCNTAMVYLTVLPVMIVLDPVLTLAALAPYPVVLLSARFLTQRLYRWSRQVADRFGALSGFIQESIAGLSLLRTYHQESHWQQRFRAEMQQFYHASVQHARLQGLFGPMMVLNGGLSVWIILTLGGNRIARGELTVGDFVAFTGYLSLLIWPTVGFGWILTILQRGLAALNRLQQVISVSPDHPEQSVASLSPDRGVAVTLSHLHFAFHAGQPAVLNNISLTIEPGQFVGLVGRIGCGKSTLLHCLARLRPIADQTIFYQGHCLNQISETALRRQVAMVTQESFLFSRSIQDNLLYGRPDGDETMAWLAAEQACLDRDIRQMPQQMATLVGERGITLSGGQRQRMALARALTLQRPLLLLDDIFSHVDAQTEQRILTTLRQLPFHPTIVLVCHRIAALRLADCIYVMDEGRIHDAGKHDDLLSRCELYQQLHHQMARQEALEILQ
ncbi:MAG: ABC transporter ATP-binding protein [Magnetococcales bacterium]|nr:ABC transporter ATP-binding protein [Magnetococcales bacterium]